MDLPAARLAGRLRRCRVATLGKRGQRPTFLYRAQVWKGRWAFTAGRCGP